MASSRSYAVLTSGASSGCRRGMWVLWIPLSIFGCTKPKGFHVVSYDRPSHLWTVMQNSNFDQFEQPTTTVEVKYTLRCLAHGQMGSEFIQGPDACDIQAGQWLIPEPSSEHNKFSNSLSVTITDSGFILHRQSETGEPIVDYFQIVKVEDGRNATIDRLPHPRGTR